MNKGTDFYLSSATDGAINHATALNSVSIKTFQKISGGLYYKVIYKVMDPARGIYKTIGSSSMKVVFKVIP